MLPSKDLTAYASVFAELHRQCFAKGWQTDEFQALLNLPTTIGIITPESFLLCAHILDEIEILTIGVLPQARRKGLGVHLLKDLSDYAREHRVSKIFLEVALNNEPAKNLYAKFGFVETGRRKDYYQTDTGTVDALCLTKIIS